MVDFSKDVFIKCFKGKVRFAFAKCCIDTAKEIISSIDGVEIVSCKIRDTEYRIMFTYKKEHLVIHGSRECVEMSIRLRRNDIPIVGGAILMADRGFSRKYITQFQNWYVKSKKSFGRSINEIGW